MIKSIYSNLLPKAVLLSVFLSPGYVISKAHANTDSISGIEQTNGKLSGRVIDAKGEPIPGANISVKGTTIGTITDMDGNFSIDVNPNQILTISFIGYETKTIPVSNQKTLNVVLQETVNQLDELVVVSYGTQKKRDLTGSVSKIDAGELESFPVGQFAQKLQGQVAGVQINQSTGQPGKGMGFRIRGAASINGGSSPLFVVDGIPINMDLSSINPDEIETFSILKDAAATSLYGSRAANGVVLITTKRGKQGKTQVDVNASFGIQTLKGLKTPDVMNGEEFAQYKKEYYEDAARYEGYTGGVPEQYQNPSQYGTGTNWYDLLTRNAATQNYSISVTANKDKFNTAIVLGYFRQDGVMYNSNFERYSLRANNDYQVNDRLKLGLNIAPTLQIKNNQNTDGGWQILSAAFLADPTVNPYDENGEPILSLNSPGMFPQPNWIRVLHEKTSKTQDLALLSNAFAELDIWNGIKYKFQAGFDLGAKNYRDFTPSTAGGAMFTAPPQKASGQYNTNFHYSWTIENMLMYNHKFGNHNIDALVGYSAQKYSNEYNQLTATDFPSDDIPWMGAGATKNGDNNIEQWALASVIARANYSFKDRYLLQATFRRDGCSRFGAGNKYANFPSISAGWIVSDEAFMEPVTNVMNYLKIRASYGLTGNYNIGNYRYIAGVSTYNYVLGGSLAPGKGLGNLGNNALTWEETKQLDLGVDIGFLNDRIYLMYDYYNKNGTKIQPNAKPGDFKFAKLGGEGELNDDDDRTFIGDPNPDLIYGFNLGFNYKNFDVSMAFQGTIGNDIWNTSKGTLATAGNQNALAEAYTDAWRQEGDIDAKYPRITNADSNNNYRASSFYVEDGSYLRLQNLQIGYTLPAYICQKTKLFSSCRLYLSGQNVFTLTGYSGLDPEIGVDNPLDMGVDNTRYPAARSFTFGVNLQF